MDGSGRGLIKVLFPHLPGGAGGNHETPPSVKMAVFRRPTRFEAGVLTTLHGHPGRLLLGCGEEELCV